MDFRKQESPDESRAEATLDAFGVGRSAGSSSIPDEICPRVALVEGSGPGLSGETRLLLRTRLRASALVICLGSLAFFIRSLFESGVALTDPALVRGQQFLLWFHLVHVVVLGLVSYKLCWRCNLSLRSLRVAETIIFGLTALFIACVQHVATGIVLSLASGAFNPVAIWFCLMFTYAIYIPNSWRRAALVLGFMAVAPVAVMLFDQVWYG